MFVLVEGLETGVQSHKELRRATRVHDEKLRSRLGVEAYTSARNSDREKRAPKRPPCPRGWA